MTNSNDKVLLDALVRTLYGLTGGSPEKAVELLHSLPESLSARFVAIRAEYKRTCVNCGRTYVVARTNAPAQGFCEVCDSDSFRAELARVQKQNRRAVREHRPATLTFREWRETLDDFHWKCAYCTVQPFTDLEHFIPLRRGGGTTKGNVVPSCSGCNYFKRSKNPLRAKRIRKIEPHRIEYVRQYLARRERGEHDHKG